MNPIILLCCFVLFFRLCKFLNISMNMQNPHERSYLSIKIVNNNNKGQFQDLLGFEALNLSGDYIGVSDSYLT